MYRKAKRGYKNSGEMDKPISGIRPTIRILFGVFFWLKFIT